MKIANTKCSSLNCLPKLRASREKVNLICHQKQVNKKENDYICTLPY